MQPALHSCPNCDKKFSQPELLARHKRRQHPLLWCAAYLGSKIIETQNAEISNTTSNLVESASAEKGENNEEITNTSVQSSSVTVPQTKDVESQQQQPSPNPADRSSSNDVINSLPHSGREEVQRRSSDATEKIGQESDQVGEEPEKICKDGGDLHEEQEEMEESSSLSADEEEDNIDANFDFVGDNDDDNSSEKISPSPPLLQKVAEEEENRQRYRCRFCTKSFRQRQSQLAHENSRHTKYAPYGCGHCAKTFPTYYAKYRHQASAHGKDKFGKFHQKKKSSPVVPDVPSADAAVRKKIVRLEDENEGKKSGDVDLQKYVHILEARKILSESTILRQKVNGKDAYLCALENCFKIFSTFALAAGHVFTHLDGRVKKEGPTTSEDNDEEDQDQKFAKNVLKTENRNTEKLQDRITPHHSSNGELSRQKRVKAEQNLAPKIGQNRVPTCSIPWKTRKDASGKIFFVCGICKKEFVYHCQFRQHSFVHSDTKPFKCSVANCGRQFSRKYLLRHHEASCRGDGNSKKSRIRQPSSSPYLDSREIKNEEDKVVMTYSCNFCKKSFTRKHTAEEHTRIHTGDRPFACPNCPRKFIRAGDLCSHQKTSRAAGSCNGKKRGRKKGQVLNKRGGKI